MYETVDIGELVSSLAKSIVGQFDEFIVCTCDHLRNNYSWSFSVMLSEQIHIRLKAMCGIGSCEMYSSVKWPCYNFMF